MAYSETSASDELRIFFRGSSRLDDAIRNARPKARFFLLRRFAEDGWRLYQQGIVVPVDLTEWAKPPFDGAPVSVRYPIDDQSPLAAHLRSLPCDRRGARSYRMDTLRAFASAGLAAQGQALQPAMRAASDTATSHGRGASDFQQRDPAPNDDMSHLPFGSLAKQVTLA